MNKNVSDEVPRLHAYFEEHRKELLDDIMDMIRIPSVNAPEEKNAPFGVECVRALEAITARAEVFGLKPTILENKVAYVDIHDCPAQLDILAHVDVVPAGDGWSVTEPFVPLLRDGKLYGRGTCDDKGPAVAALYAMRAVRELNISLKYNVRLILGADEETGCRDTDCYYSHFKEAPCSYSPDGEYPVINLEKGGLYTSYSGTWEEKTVLPCIRRIDGGTVGNAVPGKAEAVIEGILTDEIAEVAIATEEQTGIAFRWEEKNGCIVIYAEGKSTHASTPWEGNSALTGLLALLMRLPFADCEGQCRLRGLAGLFPHGTFYGEAAGVAQADELSGRLVLTSNVLHYAEGSMSGRIDCRAPMCASEETVLEVLREKLAAYGLHLPESCKMIPPHYVPENSPFIQTLLGCYEQIMGELGRCLTIGGGTYAHFLKNGVAFGASKQGIDYHMHGADEYLVVDEIIRSAELFALTIIALCSE